ncbi:MAG: hypothetical protein ACI934_000384, partial [Pseudohongiellaceae bacterium]
AGSIVRENFFHAYFQISQRINASVKSNLTNKTLGVI